MLVPGSRAFTILLGALSGLTALSVDMSLPALPRLTAVFATTPDRAQLTLSVFLIGFAVGQLFYGPLSDRFGRRPVLLAGLAIYALGGFGCALSASIDQLVAFRLLQGIGGGVGRVMAPAIVRDAFKAQDGAKILSHITQVVALAPLVAPMIGGLLLAVADWRAIFLVLAACGAAILAATAMTFAETSRYRDASATRLDVLLRNYVAFLSERACLGYMLINCCVFAGLFSYISGSSFVFIEVFGVSSQVYGVLFGLTALAFMVGAAVNARLVRRHPPQRLLRVGILVVLAGGMTLFAGALLVPGIPGVMLPMMVFVFGMGLVMPNATAAAMEPMPHMAGLAASLLGASQMAAGSLAGYLVNRFYDKTPLAMASGIALAALGAFLIHLLLIRRATSSSPAGGR
jgi:DHA1 family bicyclomycin/chloramphenicol resistance-like MFS transporter